MAQPRWITPAGSLGTIPEGIFYKIILRALADENEDVFFRVIAGELPTGVQVTETGSLEGTPKNLVNVQGVPTEVNEDITSKFTIRAYTVKSVDGQSVVDRINDRTFTITVTGQDAPQFITPAGNIGTFFDSTEVSVPLRFTDDDFGDSVSIRVVSGELPPGLILDSRTGIISGIIRPIVGPPGTALAGYDMSEYDQFPFEFSTRASSKNFQFSVEISDGKDSNIRTFEIFVYARDAVSADDLDITSDNIFITADVSPERVPLLLTKPGSLGRVRSDNFWSFKFDSVDFDGDPVAYEITLGANIGFDPLFIDNGSGERDPATDLFNNSPGSFSFDNEGFDRGNFSLPPGLQLDGNTGWLYGYIPNQGTTETTYRFAIRVKKANRPEIISKFYYFTLTIIGPVDTEVQWLTDSDLGVISNGEISTLSVSAINSAGRLLEYRLVPGSNSRLPQGLSLLPSGNITGKVSFNTFTLDSGSTTFDKVIRSRLINEPTTFDQTYQFTVNAFSSLIENPGYEIVSIVILDGGSGYVENPTVSISSAPNTADAVDAQAGTVSIVDGKISAIAIGNPGRGYTSIPEIIITGGGGSGAVAVAQVRVSNITNVISVFKTFTIRVARTHEEPYQNLYVKAMPPEDDRNLIQQLLQNQDLIPNSSVYRPDDANFGVSKDVKYVHAYGLKTESLETYVNALQLNHYWKNLTLGNIEYAEARDDQGNVIYEVVYSRVIDNLINNQNLSVSKSVKLPFSVNKSGTIVDTVYPNSLDNMRNQVIGSVGRITSLLPRWMLSKQSDGRVLGFTPAWVIAYVKPGQGAKIVYNIKENFGNRLNRVDYRVDRYEIDRSMSFA